MLDEKGLCELLDRENVAYERHDHPAVLTMEASEALGLPAGAEPMKNLFICDAKRQGHWLVSLPGGKRLDLKRLRALLGSKRLTFAPEEDLQGMLGVERGAVTPFGVLNDKTHGVVLVMDAALRGKRVHAHPLVNTATLYVLSDDIARLAKEHGTQVRWLDL